MNRMSKIVRLDSWLASLAVSLDRKSGGPLVCRAMMTTAQTDATSKLSRVSGPQIVAARAECVQTGDSDVYGQVLSTAIFVLDKGLGTARTEELENAQYSALAELADAVMGRLSGDLSSGSCNLLSGLELASVNITPESSIFGGWCGYSVELSFKC